MFGLITNVLGTLAANKFAEEQQTDSQNFNEDQAAQTRTFNAAEAEKQRAWTRLYRGSTYQDTVNDLKAANLNPMLAVAHGGTQGPGGSAASAGSGAAGIASPGSHPDIQQAMQSAAQIRLIEAEEDKVRAETEEIRGARIPERLQNIEVMKQTISESQIRIEKLWEEVVTMRFSQDNLAASTAKLKAELPKIKAEIDALRAQTVERLTASGLNEAHAKEVHQRIQANLPQIERTLHELEAISRRLAQPGQEASAAAADSYVGQLGAYLKSLGIGLNNLMIAIPTGRQAAPARSRR